MVPLIWKWMISMVTNESFEGNMTSYFKWKDKDFIQVQSEHCSRLCKAIPNLEKCLKNMEISSKMKILNKNQCVHLYKKLILATKGIEKMLSSATEDLKFQSILEELHCLQKKIEIVGKSCIDEDQWCYSVLFQLQSKESFRELLLDLMNCYNTARDVYLVHHPNQANNMSSIQFDAATYKQVVEDGQDLKRKLELALEGKVSKDYELVQHLLLRLRNLERVDGGDLDALEIPNDFHVPELVKKIGDDGGVYESNWCGLTCATKIIKGDATYLMNSRKEAGILAGLSHPNLVQFFGCGLTKKIDELKEDEIGKMHLVMELMESSLSTILKKVRRPLSYHVAIEIMHQIAKGVYYLHDMQVAHLDLKPSNVLSSSMPMKDLDPHCMFKVMDYGTSQLEVCTNPKDPKPSHHVLGTRGYMPPEMIKGSKTPLYPFQADVWSFAMICSEILSGKVPYFGLKAKEFCDQISYTHSNGIENLRPNLPNNLEELTNLIQECWAQDPLQRPTFSYICKRLTNLKKSFLRGIYSSKMVPQFGSPCTSRDSKSTMDHVPKMDECIAPLEDTVVDLERQLSKARELLLKHNYLGIVGMGGIGKTTLAKAIFEDATKTSSYHASCFVAQSKNYQSSYAILCKILLDLGNEQNPKNLEDAQKMMKEILVRKNVLLILDDVKNEALVLDIVPPNIVQASKNATIILTTREWSTIKSFVDIGGKLDVELLDEKASTRLFTTHLSWGVAPLSPDFEDLCNHVVETCNGLPLSLKVMGSYLRSKARLRSWERALQRMARGKSLDGDEEIWNTLKISYDGLTNGVEKGMFLDIACFFSRDVHPCGISKATILYMWSKDGTLPVNDLERLIDMSLLKVNKEGNILEMHDQLRDMGRMIAKNSRIWKTSMIQDSGFTSKDVEVLEGISWQGTVNEEGFHILQDDSRLKIINHYDKSFDFNKLRLLILMEALDDRKGHVDKLISLLQLASQSSRLEAVLVDTFDYMTRCPLILPAHIARTLSSKIFDLCSTHKSLKILDLVGLGFLEQLPNKFASSHTLLRLKLNFCTRLVAFPNEIGNLSCLTTLDLNKCSSLVALLEEVGNLSSLTTLNLSGCSSLMALPKEVGNLSCLTTLDLSECLSLVALPEEVGNLSGLTTLDLSGCSNLMALAEGVGSLSCLTTLDLWRCSSLMALPEEVGNLSCLTTLNLSGCSSLVALPEEVGNLSSLTTLNLRRCSSLMALPEEVGNLSSLTTLNLSGCSSLMALPKEVGNLSCLTTLDLSECLSLVALPEEVGNLSCLTTLDLSGCSNLMALAEGVGSLSCLTTLDLWRCSSLMALPEEVGNLSCLTTLNLSGCSSLVALPEEVGNLSSLTTLNLRRCSSLMALPEEVGNLSSLTTLNLSGCSSLMALPKEVGNLSCLTTLDLSECLSLVALPEEVGNLSCLTTLNLSGCSSLVALPEEVGNLSCLTTLNLNKCSSLVALPEEVGNLSSLTTLNLRWCLSLMALPKEVGNLSSLTTLNLNKCSSLVALPEEVGNLSSLTTLNLRWCLSLMALPKEVENLSSLTTLNLSWCSSLVALPEEVGNLSCLTTLDLSECSSLVALPEEVGNLSCLTTLDLSECSSLVALPEEVGNLSCLTTLYLSGCSSLVALLEEVGNLSSLTTLNLRRSSSLMALPKEVGNLSCLTTLNLSGCSSLVALPEEVGNLSFLNTLDLSGYLSLDTLPMELEKLYDLIELKLDGCVLLSSLPKNIGCIPSIQLLSWENCPKLEPYMLVEMSEPTSLTSLQDKYFCLEGDHHDGVVCDKCEVTPRIGPCYKANATFKNDYDLCLKCFIELKLLLENCS